jgi:hypothetical protein
MRLAALDWSIFDRILGFAADLRSVLGIRFNKRPLRSVEELVEFIHTRAAYVAQTSLYGYVKTRMGTRYPLMFQDDGFAASINAAKWRVFAACLGDLTVFAAASVAASDRLGPGDAARLANDLFEASVRRTFTPDVARVAMEVVKGFAAVAGKPMRLVLQGVGDRVQHYFDRAWRSDEARRGQIVVIGERELDQRAVEAALLG